MLFGTDQFLQSFVQKYYGNFSYKPPFSGQCHGALDLCFPDSLKCTFKLFQKFEMKFEMSAAYFLIS